jgi:hypothetical protein
MNASTEVRKLIRQPAGMALRVARGQGIRLAKAESVMAKKKGGGKLLPLPFTTFGDLAALGLKATVYCSRCYQHRPIDPAAEHLRDRCFATTRFRCCEIRYTGDVCGCLESVAIKPPVLLPVGGKDTPAFLFCITCEPSWEINHVPIDQPPMVSGGPEQQRPLQVPGVREGRGVAYSRAELAPRCRPRRRELLKRRSRSCTSVPQLSMPRKS